MEYLLKHHDDEFILVFENKNTIIVGRNQNTYEVVNETFVNKHKTHVIRRISGGGAVYQDVGNINFVYIVKAKNNFNNFLKFIEPVMSYLEELGLHAEFKGRNDLEINGKKISGNAQTTYKNRMMHGGTLLYDLDLDRASDALRVDEGKYRSKGIQSNRARIQNVKPLLKSAPAIKDFKQGLLETILDTDELDKNVYTLSQKEEQMIDKLMKQKYETWEWNYGKSPEYNVVKGKRFSRMRLDFYLQVRKNTIHQVKIFSDGLFCQEALQTLETCLKGVKYTETDVRAALLRYEENVIADDVGIEAIVHCLFDV